MVLIAQSRIFEILLKLILALVPKHNLSHMFCSPITKIYKNSGGQEAIVSKAEKQLNITRFSRPRKSSLLPCCLTLFKISITSPNLGIWLCMLVRSKRNVLGEEW
jgi:hypothetical protein